MTKLIMVFIAAFVAVLNAEVIVTTPNGKIRGRQEYSQRKISFYAFQQIPFAKPPVGSLRFKVSSIKEQNFTDFLALKNRISPTKSYSRKP
uniref:Esterase-5B-like n=1 Tax=Diabrotica virgifera virgifera TaxID=50390 RepID=A0A6P7G3Q6_DIAVI